MIASCKSKSKLEESFYETQKKSKIIDLFGLDYSNITLTTTFAECGEWGGHVEGIKLYSELNTKLIKLDYYRNALDCKMIMNNQVLTDTVIKKTITLNVKKQKAVDKYLQILMSRKLKTKILMHAGNSFVLKNRDSSLYLEVFDPEKESTTSYLRLLSTLELN